MITGKERFSD